MSSFRLERECVTFKPRPAEPVKTAPAALAAPAAAVNTEAQQEAERLEALRREAAELEEQAQQNLANAQAECQRVTEEARKEAARILAEAQKQAQELMKQEKERGYAEGQAASEEETRQQRAENQRRLSAQIRSLKAMYDSKVNAVQEDVTELVAEMTEKIIAVKLQQDDQAFLNVIAMAMSRFRQSDDLTVHLSEEDYRHYNETGGIQHLDEARGRNVFLAKDASVEKNGCILESENGFVDCGVPGQMERMKEILRSEKDSGGYDEDPSKVQGSLA